MIKIERKYKGVTITQANYRDVLQKEGRDGINFHTRHLEAYLKGQEFFRHGYRKDKDGNTISPHWHLVKQTNKVV